ncbi:type II toxin-antitoxin system VapC family toxin [Leptospira kanakyensis]|uniref:type II toxin-antitoxin system VapC family toxin n=1 Tax=Leptospira kanakyensis TaxID=2484968 RepID=UPI00223D4585|nr:PIN domain-containing protein [Leptospira kanakyensis]MCW7481095.1 PIN domain-containing protein [Leptospira kanakyensis]
MKTHVYLDSDVIIDYLYARDPFFQESLQIFSLIETKEIKASVSSLIIWNIYYILSKYISEKKTRELIKDFRSIIDIISVDDKIIDLALNSSMKDFEDSVQFFAAKSKKVKYIITRNKKDYPSSEIIVISPKEFLNLIKTLKS